MCGAAFNCVANNALFVSAQRMETPKSSSVRVLSGSGSHALNSKTGIICRTVQTTEIFLFLLKRLHAAQRFTSWEQVSLLKTLEKLWSVFRGHTEVSDASLQTFKVRNDIFFSVQSVQSEQVSTLTCRLTGDAVKDNLKGPNSHARPSCFAEVNN